MSLFVVLELNLKVFERLHTANDGGQSRKAGVTPRIALASEPEATTVGCILHHLDEACAEEGMVGQEGRSSKCHICDRGRDEGEEARKIRLGQGFAPGQLFQEWKDGLRAELLCKGDPYLGGDLVSCAGSQPNRDRPNQASVILDLLE